MRVLERAAYQNQRTARRVTRCPAFANDLGQGEGLVFHGVRKRLGRVANQIFERPLVGNFRAERKHVDKEANGIFKVTLDPPREGTANQERTLAGVAVHQDLDDRQKHRWQRDTQ